MSNKKKARPAAVRRPANHRPASAALGGFDIDSLTLGDLEALETYGVSLEDLGRIAELDVEAGKLPPARILTAVAWIMGKQSDPDLTIDACRDLTLDEMLAKVSETASTPLPDAVKN